MLNKISKIIKKKDNSKIVALTAYSKSIAKILDKYCDIVWRLYGQCIIWT